MRLSRLFTKTLREAPADELAVNAQLLTRGGFVFKNSAGIYSFLPLGWRVAQKIMNVIREEMNVVSFPLTDSGILNAEQQEATYLELLRQMPVIEHWKLFLFHHKKIEELKRAL